MAPVKAKPVNSVVGVAQTGSANAARNCPKQIEQRHDRNQRGVLEQADEAVDEVGDDVAQRLRHHDQRRGLAPGQAEGFSRLGLSWGKTTALVVMPQAVRHASQPRQQLHQPVQGHLAGFDRRAVRSPGIVARGVFRSKLGDATTLFTGFAFTGIVYFVFCFGMSRYSLFVENRLNAHRRN